MLKVIWWGPGKVGLFHGQLLHMVDRNGNRSRNGCGWREMRGKHNHFGEHQPNWLVNIKSHQPKPKHNNQGLSSTNLFILAKKNCHPPLEKCQNMGLKIVRQFGDISAKIYVKLQKSTFLLLKYTDYFVKPYEKKGGFLLLLLLLLLLLFFFFFLTLALQASKK